jgi:catechol 2,3-dioxygenase-like lactoylglutathione lyase family enzyme
MTVRLGATIPALPSADVARSVEFYRERLGFDLVHAEGDGGFAIVRRDDATIHLWGATDEGWRERLDPVRPVCSGAETFIAGTASCRIQVDGVDELYGVCAEGGIVHPNATLADQWWGSREFGVLDPDGNLVTFFEPRP